MKADVYNLKNEKVGTTELPDKIFGAKWRPILVHQILVAIAANLRRPWAHAKTRAEVRGGGRKPWRQKGTGRARHGSTRSPLWVGGGKAHGPSNLRDYTQKVNKKMRGVALVSALSKKFKDGGVKVFESLEVEKPKTKVLATTLKQLIQTGKSKKFDVLLVAQKENANITRAASNLPKVKTLNPESLNVYDVMNYKNIFIETKAVETMSKHFNKI